jgi:hypothetical protein
MHHRERRCEFIGALFAAFVPVHLFELLPKGALCVRRFARHNAGRKLLVVHAIT